MRAPGRRSKALAGGSRTSGAWATPGRHRRPGWWRDGGTFTASGTPIQAAVSNANAGETSCVAAGSYNENVNIATPHLTLRGEGAGVATVTAANSGDHVFEVTAGHVNISGFTATGATAGSYPHYVSGIYLNDADLCNISYNTASNNNYGIYMYGPSDGNTLNGNSASNNNYGIHMYRSSNNTLLGNTANSNAHDGIYLDNADNNNITCNWVHNNTDAGVYLKSGSTGNTIKSNNIIANGNYNDTSSGWEWQFRNDQSDDVVTSGNWWGTDNETRINASIHDWTYNVNWGNVTTNPKLDGPVPCAPTPIPEESPATTVDAVIALEMAVGSHPLDLRYDVNGDGQVTSLDALMIAMDARTG